MIKLDKWLRQQAGETKRANRLRKQAREKEMAAQAAKVGPLAQVAALAASERPKTGDKIPRSTKIAPFSDLSCKAEDAISKYSTAHYGQY